MYMKKLLLFIVLVAFPLLAIAQASGGQISRKTKSMEIKKQSKVNGDKKENVSSKEKQIAPETPPKPIIDPISINSLSTYNIVGGSFSLLSKASNQCYRWREAGYKAQIYLDSKGIYQVVLQSFNVEQDALNFRTYVRNYSDHPEAWILYIVNGHEERYFH